MNSTTAREIRKLQQRLGRVEPKAPGEGAGSGSWSPIAFNYYSTGGDNVPGDNSLVIVDYDTEEFAIGDGTVTPGASWNYESTSADTVYLCVHAAFEFDDDNNWVVDDTAKLWLYKNGSAFRVLDEDNGRAATGFWFRFLEGTATIPMDLGDTLDVRIQQNSGSDISCSGNSDYNYIDIFRVA